MKTNSIKLQDIAKQAGVSQTMLSLILNGKRRAGWKTAKGLAKVTGQPETLFLEGDLFDIQLAIQFSRIGREAGTDKGEA